ncbi:hypothetical protein GCM10023321_13800 [Pseudonocardia eucalypti]|uniref:ChrR-like cupin domain-containing protein n=1 Tax=Pseudonocardia eucalypti TaxID=648755 RepID=A0ABP9PNU2_9PSEU|nr:hypothetical protein [Pseudonocardia eucalypti]
MPLILNETDTFEGTEAVCVHYDDLAVQAQGFGGRQASSWDQRFFQVINPQRGIAVTNNSALELEEIRNVRHAHTFSQVRYFHRGAMKFGKDTVEEGDLQFVGDSVKYGPMASVENPTARCHMLQTQFTGPSNRPFLDQTLISKTTKELEKYGNFDNGIYRPDGGRPLDSFEAITIAIEQGKSRLTGEEKVQYARPRLPHPVYVRTKELPWLPVRDGVEVKHVLNMYETGPNVKLVRLAKGAVLGADTVDFQQTRWLIEGSVTWRSREYDAISCMFYPPDVEYPATRAEQDGTVLLVLQWTNSGRPVLPFLHL